MMFTMPILIGALAFGFIMGIFFFMMFKDQIVQEHPEE